MTLGAQQWLYTKLSSSSIHRKSLRDATVIGYPDNIRGTTLSSMLFPGLFLVECEYVPHLLLRNKPTLRSSLDNTHPRSGSHITIDISTQNVDRADTHPLGNRMSLGSDRMSEATHTEGRVSLCSIRVPGKRKV